MQVLVSQMRLIFPIKRDQTQTRRWADSSWPSSAGRIPYARLPLQFLCGFPRSGSKGRGVSSTSQLLAPPAYQYDPKYILLSPAYQSYHINLSITRASQCTASQLSRKYPSSFLIYRTPREIFIRFKQRKK